MSGKQPRPRTRSWDLGRRAMAADVVEGRDDRPPICPACGVTMGLVADEGGSTRAECLECGFSEDGAARE